MCVATTSALDALWPFLVAGGNSWLGGLRHVLGERPSVGFFAAGSAAVPGAGFAARCDARSTRVGARPRYGEALPPRPQRLRSTVYGRPAVDGPRRHQGNLRGVVGSAKKRFAQAALGGNASLLARVAGTLVGSADAAPTNRRGDGSRPKWHLVCLHHRGRLNNGNRRMAISHICVHRGCFLYCWRDCRHQRGSLTNRHKEIER